MEKKYLSDFQIFEKEICEKEFEIDYKGYNVFEVDEFFDCVSSEVKNIQKESIKLKDALKIEQAKNKKLVQEISELNATISLLKEQKSALEAKGVENVDIITRLSKLESIVNED